MRVVVVKLHAFKVRGIALGKLVGKPKGQFRRRPNMQSGPQVYYQLYSKYSSI